MIHAIIRAARLDDAEALHHHCYPDATLETVRDFLAWCLRQTEKGRLVRLVADVDGQAVGNVQLTAWKNVGEIGSLAVGEPFRRKGLARLLLQAAIAEAGRCRLEAVELTVRSGEPELAAFYCSLGFQPDVDTKKELSHPESPAPDLLLRLQL